MRRFTKIGGIGCGILVVLAVVCIAVFAIASPSKNKPSPVAQVTESTVLSADTEAEQPPQLETAPTEVAAGQVETDVPLATEAPTDIKDPATSTSGKVGERVESAGIGLTVLNVQKLSSAGIITAAEGNIVVDIEVALENISREETPYNPFYFKIKDNQNFEYDVAFGSLDPSLQSGDLKQGELARGHVAFEIPKDAKGLVVSYEPMVLFGGYEPLKVNLEEVADNPITDLQSNVAPPDGKVGERVESAEIAFIVLNVQKVSKIDFFTAEAGNIYVDIEVVIQNSGRDETTPFNPMYFKLKDSDGYEYTTSLTGIFPDLKSGELDKGDMVRGHVAFEVPEKATGLVVSYEPEVLFGGYKPVKIDLDQKADQSPEIPAPIVLPPYSLGTSEESAGISLTVFKVQTGKSVGGIAAGSGRIYLDIDVEIRNVSRSEAAPYNPLYFKVKDSNGFEYTAGFTSLEPSLTSGDLPMGEAVRGHVAFEIPQDSKGLAVSYVPEVLFGGYRIIRIGLP